MFNVGDEIECIDDSSIEGHAPWPFRKGQRFIVQGYWPVGSWIGYGQVTGEDGVSVGVENVPLRQQIEATGWFLPHYDLWYAHRFRKIEKKRDRAELYTLLGISDMLNGTTRELTHV